MTPYRCRQCGGTWSVESRPVSGVVKRLLDERGELWESDLDSIVYGPTPATVRCADCKTRRPHPRLLLDDDGAA